MQFSNLFLWWIVLSIYVARYPHYIYVVIAGTQMEVDTSKKKLMACAPQTGGNQGLCHTDSCIPFLITPPEIKLKGCVQMLLLMLLV